MPYIKHMAYDAIEHMRNNDALAEKSICATGARVGRKMRYPEKREAAFAPGTLSRIQAVLGDDETQVSFIREAVERELERREKGR
ncbi:hypothetical protein BH11PSE6_BH11PSE6_00170 [soil metagenome]